MAKLPEITIDETLLDIDKALEEKQKEESPRHYLGMSQIGEECRRKLFYSFRNAEKRNISASGLRAIKDGYDQEDVMIERLRMLPYIELHTTDPVNPDKQIGFSLLLDHFRGNCDGMILGIKVAPGTWHVWENKAVNIQKFDKLKKLKETLGEKEALKEWDLTYYEQAIMYMHCSQTTRHYLTVETPGGRDYISCRTDYNKQYAENIIEKAKSIIFDNWTIPAKLSDKREFYKCKRCEFQDICHDSRIPLVHCKTCRYSEPVRDGKRTCHKKNEILEDSFLDSGKCSYHIYNPALISAKLLEQQEDCCLYKTESGVIFANCVKTGIPEVKGEDINEIFTSLQLRNDIQYISNITKESTKIQKEFNGTIEKETEKTAWGSTIDPRLRGI